MATSANRREAQFIVDVEAVGTNSVKALAQEVRSLAKDGGDAAPQFERLAREIEKIGQQGDAVANVQKLQAETDQLKASADKAAASEQNLGEKMAEASKRVLAAQEAYQGAKAAEEQLVAARNASIRQLATLVAETDRAGKSEDAYKEQTKNLRLEQIKLAEAIEQQQAVRRTARAEVTQTTASEKAYADQVRRAATEAKNSNEAYRQRAAVLEQAQVAAGKLGVNTEQLAAEEVRLRAALQGVGGEVNALSQELAIQADEAQQAAFAQQKFAEAVKIADAAMAEQVATLAKTEAAMAAYAEAQTAAVSAGERDLAANEARIAAANELIATDERLSAAQRELANARNAEREATLNEARALTTQARAAQESLNVTRQLIQESRSAGRVIEEAFAATGVRSLQAIETEIHQTEAALSTLERKFAAGAISARDLERATGGAQVRLAQLQAEIAKTPSAPGMFERMNASITSLANRFGALAAAFATFGFVVKPVVEAQIELTRLERVLNTVTGSSAVTAKTIEFLRDTAQRTGQDFSETAGSFSKFAAAAVNAGVPLETVKQTFANASAAAGNLGLESAALGRILTALGQIASKGVVSMEELRGQLGESLPGALALTAKNLGLTTAELTKLIESGRLTARDAIPAISNAMKELGGQGEAISGITQRWERFVNLIKQSATEFTNGEVATGFGKMIDYMLEKMEKAEAGTKLFKGSIGQLTDVVGAAADRIIHGDFAGIEAAVVKAAETSEPKLQALRDKINGVSKESADAVPLVQNFGSAVQATASATAASATAFQAQVTAINGNAAALQALALANEAAARAVALAGQGAEGASQAWIRALVDYENAAKAAANAATASERVAQAKKIEADSLVAVAQLTGNEIELNAQRVVSAEQVAAALRDQAAADQTVVQVAQAELDALQKLVALQGVADASQAARIVALQQLIEVRSADAQKTNEQADAAERAAKAAELQYLKLQDNSKNVGEFTKKLDVLKAAEEQARLAFLAGTGTLEEYRKAQLNTAEATGLLTDAVQDQAKALEANAALVKANNDVKLAQLDLAKATLESEIKQLELEGRTYEASQKKIELKRLEIKIIQAKAEAQRLEIAATREQMEADRAAQIVAGDWTPIKEAQYQASLKMLEVRELEVQAALKQVDVLNQEIQNLELYGDTAVKVYGQVSDALDSNSAAFDRNTEAMARNAAGVNALGHAVDSSGFVLDANGNRLTMSIPNQGYAVDRLKSYGFSDEQALKIIKQSGLFDSNGNIHTQGKSLEEFIAELAKKYQNAQSLSPTPSQGNGMLGPGGGVNYGFGSNGTSGGSPFGKANAIGGTNQGPVQGGGTTKTIIVDKQTGQGVTVYTDSEQEARDLEKLINGFAGAKSRSGI